jgi:hypothetical protein
MIQNYSSLLMKDAKFRDNLLLAGAAQNGTPYIQYLIKNNKTKQVLESSGQKTTSKNNIILEELEYSLNKLRAHAEESRLGHGHRSQTSIEKHVEENMIPGNGQENNDPMRANDYRNFSIEESPSNRKGS